MSAVPSADPERKGRLRPGRRVAWLAQLLEFLALAVWVGGLIVIIGAVIPAVFNSFGGQMEPAGHFLRRVFDGYNRLVGVAIMILAVGLAVRWWQTPRTVDGQPAVTRVEVVLFGAMILLAGMIMFVAGPQALALQEQAFTAQGEAAKQEAYATFFRSHLVVRTLYLVNLGLGIGLLAVKTRR